MDGVVNIHKPIGITSFGVVHSVKKILQVKKAGHIGTLDPMAEGVLPICLNQTTKIIQFLTPLPKVYTACMALGVVTDTQDATGKTLATADASAISEEQVRDAIQSFVGEQLQTPPMFSAKKKDGIPLYKLARNGITIDRKPVPIKIYSIEFIGKKETHVTFKAHCSAGSYIRTLCHDIGTKLGCGAHMLNLVRNQVGNFDLETSVSLEELSTAKSEQTLSGKIYSIETVLGFIPEIRVKPEFYKSIIHGVPLPKSSIEAAPEKFQIGTALRVCNNNQLIAIVEPVVDQSAFALMNPNDIAFKLKRVLT